MKNEGQGWGSGGRWWCRLVAGLALLCLTSGFGLLPSARAVEGVAEGVEAGVAEGVEAGDPTAVERLHPEVVALFRRLPVQDGGRIKPFDTLARFKLLRYHGKRRLAVGPPEVRVKLDATEWLALTLLFPERAAKIPTFIVDDADVMTAIGGQAHAERRGYYSYAELMPLREALFRLGQQYQAIEAAKRSSREAQLVTLAENVADYEYLLHQFDVLRERFELSPDTLDFFIKEPQRWSASRLISEMPALRKAMMAQEEAAGGDGHGAAMTVVGGMVHRLGNYLGLADSLHLFPPDDPAQEAWLTIGGLISEGVSRQEPRSVPITRLALLEAVMAARGDPEALVAAMTVLSRELIGAAVVRGEYARVPLEVAFYQSNYFFWSLFFYLLSFMMIALGWLFATDRAPLRGAGGVARLAGRWLLQYLPLALATTCLITGIVIRCIIRRHPPVSTLYETILFIAAVGVLTAIVLEVMTRKRIALAVAPVMGAMGMFLANRYELKEAVDTMPSLAAVLRTNFWLATHVTTVTAGYAAGLLAGLLAHLYLLGRVFGFKRTEPEFYRVLDRMVYGVLCFGLLFAFVGTMLGGVWANYSWGRFWGWDPKENGALMIVLWILAVLHARMGGYIRGFGTSVCAIFCAMIVAFSWWGVNLLGVGLHSYGFTSGIMGKLTLFWAVEALVILTALIGWTRRTDG